MTSAGVKEKTKNQENLLTLALPNQSNAVIYYITSAFRFSSLTQKEKTNENRPRREGAALENHSPQSSLCTGSHPSACQNSQKMCSKN